jgi:hypothetical protein
MLLKRMGVNLTAMLLNKKSMSLRAWDLRYYLQFDMQCGACVGNDNGMTENKLAARGCK